MSLVFFSILLKIIHVYKPKMYSLLLKNNDFVQTGQFEWYFTKKLLQCSGFTSKFPRKINYNRKDLCSMVPENKDIFLGQI